MAVHVAILLEPYIRLILSGRKTIESRLTLTNRAPFRRVKPGDVIYFKASSGPYRARAIAGETVYFDHLTPRRIAELKREYNDRVCGEDRYWDWKKGSRYATFITLHDVRAVGIGPAMGPSQGVAWFTLEDRVEKELTFEVELSEAAIRNRVVRVPRKVFAFPARVCAASTKQPAEAQLTLRLGDGEEVVSDVVKETMIRFRAWGWWFEKKAAKPGDFLVFRRVGELVFELEIRRADGRESAKPQAAGRPDIWRYVARKEVTTLVAVARREDLGPRSIDVTSLVSVPEHLKATAKMDVRKKGFLSGLAVLPFVVKAYDPSVTLTLLANDGDAVEPGQCVAEFSGTLRSVLAIERVALNFVTHLSGIATLTSRYVEAAAGTRAKIYDTRKTIPGLRGLAKYAVVCGGGHSHRLGLYDAVLVKDNHIAHLGLDRLTQSLSEAVAKARALKPAVAFVEVEVDTLEQLERVLPAGPDIILLDNMTTQQMREAVALRDRVAPRVELEASGGVNLDTVRDIARTGVERIAIGALTHSAPSLDLGLDIDGGK